GGGGGAEEEGGGGVVEGVGQGKTGPLEEPGLEHRRGVRAEARAAGDVARYLRVLIGVVPERGPALLQDAVVGREDEEGEEAQEDGGAGVRCGRAGIGFHAEMLAPEGWTPARRCAKIPAPVPAASPRPPPPPP